MPSIYFHTFAARARASDRANSSVRTRLAISVTEILGGSVVTHGTQTVISNRRVGPHAYVLRTTRSEAPIDAGQCFSVGTARLAINREYSMYSAESDPFVDFLIREVDGGVVSSTLASLDEGDEVEVGGPYGSFCLDKSQIASSHYVFIASGTGIAPFASYVKTYPGLNYTAIHGVRTEVELYDHEIYDHQSFIPCVSRPDSGQARRVTDVLRTIDIDPNALFYLCGNRNMITDVVGILRERGIPGGQVFMETFF